MSLITFAPSPVECPILPPPAYYAWEARARAEDARRQAGLATRERAIRAWLWRAAEFEARAEAWEGSNGQDK